jgi:hypothetical protein
MSEPELLVARRVDWEELLRPSTDRLEDTRTRVATRVTRSPLGNQEPCYCYNCGADAGWVREGWETAFVFSLCPKCAETVGPIAHHLVEPHVEFWKEVVAAQLELYQRILTHDELVRVVDDTNNALGQLIRQGG